jgi:predicted PurR-regulated permease PerM
VPFRSLKTSPLIVLGTLVLIVASMYWARPVLIPVALAMLLTFLLSPVDNALQRRGLGRVASVALLAVLTLSLVGVIGWAITVQVEEFANNLPGYQANINKRVEDLKIRKGTTLDKVRTEFEQMTTIVTSTTAPSAAEGTQPVLVTVQLDRFSTGVWQLSPMVLPLLGSLLHVFLVVMLVTFMLLERVELRHRAIRLLGYGRLSLTTQALDEAGQRVSRYLFAQFVVNACLGATIGLGLFLLGVPYALLWAFLIAILRFIPYAGIWIAALFPLVVSLATSSNWWQPLSVIALFAVLEPVVGLLIEPMVFSQSAGTSRLAMLVAIAFWTWLWGPVGLLLATPMTACLAVVAKHVPQLEFIAVLLGDEPMMRGSVAYYKRLLAEDSDEAEAIIEEELRMHPVEQVFDEVLIPALHYTKRDSRLGLLTDDEQQFVYKTTREIIERIALPPTSPQASPVIDVVATGASAAVGKATSLDKIHVLAWPARDEGDAIALLMLQQILDPTRFEVEMIPVGKQMADVVQEVAEKNPALFCIGFIPPGGLSATRHLSRMLRTRRPDLTIVVGLWGLQEKAQRDREGLLNAGSTQVAVTLSETREQIVRAMEPRAKLQPA